VVADDGIFVSVFVRRLRDGKTYDDFKAAWYPEQGFGVPTRVLNGVRLDDPREILSIGFVDPAGQSLEEISARIGAAEAKRHDAIDDVLESTELRAVYQLVDDQDFTDAPHPFGGEAPGVGITSCV
jgi:hypothetical protein